MGITRTTPGIIGNVGAHINKGQDTGEHNILAYGAKGNDTLDDSQAILDAITAINAQGGYIFFPRGKFIINTDLNITVPIKIAKGAVLVPKNHILTITDHVEAGHYSIFEYSGTGTVSFVGNYKLKEVYPQWWGAKGDNATDDSVAIQSAIISAKERVVYFPSGIYKCNIYLPTYYAPALIGADPTSTTLKSYTGTSDVILKIYTFDNAWDYQIIKNLEFYGNSGESAGSRTITGVRFGHDTYTQNDELCGRFRFDNCQFRHLAKGIHKKYANLDVNVEYSSFHYNDYGIYAEMDSKESYAIPMNTGQETYYKTIFHSHKLACIYIDCTIPVGTTWGNGQNVIRDCDFEVNPGFSIFVYDYGSLLNCSLLIESTWFENHSEADTDTETIINGVTYTRSDLYFRNTRNVIVRNSVLKMVELVNSTLVSNDCKITVTSRFIKDDNSLFIHERLYNIFGYDPVNTGLVLNPVHHSRGNEPYNSPWYTTPRNKSYANGGFTILANTSFAKNSTYSMVGAAHNLMTQVNDGILFPTCQKLDHYRSYGNLYSPVGIYPSNDTFTITSGKYYVYSLDFKLLSGYKPHLQIGYGGDDSRIVYNTTEYNKWYTFTGIFKSSDTRGSCLWVNAPGTAIGDSTSQFDITNPSGTTFRYTWDGTGTDPAITGINPETGTTVYVNAQNMSAGNKGNFVVTDSGTNWFEVTNAGGVVESNKTIGTGAIYVDALSSYQFSAFQIIEFDSYDDATEFMLTNQYITDDHTGTGLAVFNKSPTLEGSVSVSSMTTAGFVKNAVTTGLLSGGNSIAVADIPAMTSAELATKISDETGSGKVVFDTSPTLVTPTLGVAKNTSLNTTHEAVTFIQNPIHYNSEVSPVGTLKISLPVLNDWQIMKIRITGLGYDTVTNNTDIWEAIVKGCNYTGNIWYGYSADINGHAPFSSIRLATDGTKNVILLGTTTTQWYRPKVVVAEVILSGNITTWDTGWAVTITNDETDIVNVYTPVIASTIVGQLNHDGTKVGVYGTTPVVKGAALTEQLTTITCTAPGTPDYAIANPVQNTGFGFSTSDEMLSLLKTVANLQTIVAELKARLGDATGPGFFVG